MDRDSKRGLFPLYCANWNFILSRVCGPQCTRGAWTVPSWVCCNFWLALKWSDSWTEWSLKIPSKGTIVSLLRTPFYKVMVNSTVYTLLAVSKWGCRYPSLGFFLNAFGRLILISCSWATEGLQGWWEHILTALLSCAVLTPLAALRDLWAWAPEAVQTLENHSMAMGSALVKPFTVIVLLWILQRILSSISTFGVRQDMCFQVHLPQR